MADLTFQNALASDGKYYNVVIPAGGVAAPVAVAAPAPTPEPTPEPPPPPPAPEPTSTIPLSWSDPLFANVVTSSSVTVASGAILLNKSIAVHNEPASVVMNGGSVTAPTVLKKVRIGGLSREGVRIGGGTYLIEDCWIEAKGSGSDHADSIQAYDGGAARFNLTIRNSLIRAYNTAATAGLFVADNCTGDVNLDNVVFWGGPYGLRLHADVGGDINVYAKDVFFVGPFGYDKFMFLNYGGKKVLVKDWTNVREATIVNGVLVPGNAIPRPL